MNQLHFQQDFNQQSPLRRRDINAISFLKQFPQYFLRPCGRATFERCSQDQFIASHISAQNCEWACRPSVAASELATTIWDNGISKKIKELRKAKKSIKQLTPKLDQIAEGKKTIFPFDHQVYHAVILQILYPLAILSVVIFQSQVYSEEFPFKLCKCPNTFLCNLKQIQLQCFSHMYYASIIGMRFKLNFCFIFVEMSNFSSHAENNTLTKKQTKKMLKSFTFLDTIDQQILDQFVHTGAAMFSMAINLKVAQFCVADLERLNKVVIKQNFATCQDAFKKDASIENFRDWTLNSTLAKSKQNFILTTKKKLVELLNDDSLDKENDTSNASAPKQKLLYPSTSKFTLPNNFQQVITVDSSSADNDQGPTIFKKKKRSFQEQCFPKKCLPNATNKELLTKNRRKKKTTKKGNQRPLKYV